MGTDLDKLAKGLTEAGRAWVLAGGYCDDKFLAGSSRRLLYRLEREGLFTAPTLGSSLDRVLSPLGLALKAHIERNGDA